MKNTNLYDILEQIKKRPGMYFGNRSIFCLQSFIDGYFYVKQEIKLKG